MWFNSGVLLYFTLERSLIYFDLQFILAQVSCFDPYLYAQGVYAQYYYLFLIYTANCFIGYSELTFLFFGPTKGPSNGQYGYANHCTKQLPGYVFRLFVLIEMKYELVLV